MKTDQSRVNEGQLRRNNGQDLPQRGNERVTGESRSDLPMELGAKVFYPRRKESRGTNDVISIAVPLTMLPNKEAAMANNPLFHTGGCHAR